MRKRGWMVVVSGLLAGLAVVWGAWGYFVAAPPGPIAPGGFEVWTALRPAEGWQNFWAYRDGLRYYGGALFLLTVALALFHYAAVGPDRVPLSGRTVLRYRWGEVLTHLVLTLTFLLLWVSGLYLLWNRLVLEGPHPSWGRLASAVHIWGGLLFLVGLVGMWLKWRRDMRFVSYDREWLRHAGGYLRRDHPQMPAGRFNAGQKIWYRGTLLCGVILGATGLLLYYPGGMGLTATVQRLLFIVHTAAAVVMISGVLVHLYLATIANPGALTAMVTGRMDEALIRAHHPEMMPMRGGAPADDDQGSQPARGVGGSQVWRGHGRDR